MAFVGQLQGRLGRRRGVERALAGAPQCEHVAAFEPIARTAAQGHDLVLPGVERVAIDRDDAARHRRGRRARREGRELACGHGRQTVTDAGFEPRAGDGEGGRHHGAGADGVGARLALAHELRVADEHAFEAQHFLGVGVEQRLGLAVHAEVARAAKVAAHIGGLAARNHDVAFLRRHDARRGVECAGVEDHGLVEEGADEVQGDRGDCAIAQQRGAHARRELDGVGRQRRAALRHAQARPAVSFLEHQHLPRVDEVGVADLLDVHAPQLGPAPGAFEEELGDVPQRVAALHGVRIGRVGRQVGQGHAGLGHRLCRATLLRRDWKLRLGGQRRARRTPGRCQAEREAQSLLDRGLTMAWRHGAGLPRIDGALPSMRQCIVLNRLLNRRSSRSTARDRKSLHTVRQILPVNP